MSKKALGKGIGALIQSANTEEKSEAFERIDIISLDKIETNPLQPRKEFDEEKIKELAASIKEKGIIQPIIVEKAGDKYRIVAGERRFRAAKYLGLKEIPVISRRFTEEEKLEVALIENIQRESLNPIEEAEAFKAIIEKTELNQDELAKKVGKNRSTIANSLRLLKLPAKIKAAVVNGKISSGHARAILSLINTSDYEYLFNIILNKGMSVREAEEQALSLNNGGKIKSTKSTGPVKKKAPEISEIEQKLLDKFGTKVNVIGDVNKGKIELYYYTQEDLERIFDLLVNI